MAVSHHNIRTFSHASMSDVSSTQFSFISFKFKIRNFIGKKRDENTRNSSLVLKMNTDRPLNIRSLSQNPPPKKQHFTETRKHLRLSHPEQKAPLYSCLFPPPDGNGKRRQRSLNTGLSNMQQFQVWGFLGLAAHKTLVH